MQPIEIFRTGTHTAMSGDRIAFGEAELQAAAAAYDPALHEAPMVVGHPVTDGPAYGWVGGLRYDNGALEATPTQVDPAFAELVRDGRFKKISAAFYTPDAPTNPKPGAYYLRHVGFLGAQPPAVKGLKPVAFAADADGIVEFSDGYTLGIVARLFRGMREFMIAQFGQDRADQVIPSWDVETLSTEAVRESLSDAADAAEPISPGIVPTPMPGFTEPQKEPPVAETAEQLTVREQALAAREADFAEREARIAAAEAEARTVVNTALLDRLVQDGRLLPALRAETAAFMARLDHAGVLEFGEGRSLTPLAAFQELLGKLPRAVDLRPLPGGDAAVDGTPRDLALAATAFQEKEAAAGRSITYAAAVMAARKEQAS